MNLLSQFEIDIIKKNVHLSVIQAISALKFRK